MYSDILFLSKTCKRENVSRYPRPEDHYCLIVFAAAFQVVDFGRELNINKKCAYRD